MKSSDLSIAKVEQIGHIDYHQVVSIPAVQARSGTRQALQKHWAKFWAVGGPE
jgi:hypothetical protein